MLANDDELRSINRLLGVKQAQKLVRRRTAGAAL